MNPEAYIKNELLKHVAGDHPTVISIFETSAAQVIEKYRKHDYIEFMPMIEEAAEDIKETTQIVSFLIKGGTITDFSIDISVAYETARLMLNKSPYMARNTNHRPYRYYLKK